VSKYQDLSENFIREFENKVNWDCISLCQDLSLDFIKEFKDKIDREQLIENKKVIKKLVDSVL
ncbi:unnamed protein product, partial [marine sediment metagenome]